MNPFSDIVRVDESKNIIYPQLIGVGSTSGHGKSLVMTTIAFNFIKSVVNVLLFSESSRRFRNTDLVSHELEKTLGKLIILDFFYEDTIQSFNQKIAHHLEFLTGSCVIIIDGPMFDLNNNSFSYTKFKDENTRVVIFEKYNLKARLSYIRKTEENKYVRQREIAETLRSLALNFNTHVIISNQHRASVDDTTMPINSSIVYASDIYFSIKKRENIFSITRLKDRNGLDGMVAECVLEDNHLTLTTI